MTERLSALTSLYGPSGRESRVRDYIHDQMRGLGQQVRIDEVGNLIVSRAGSSGKRGKLMIAAPMDQQGLIVGAAAKKGLLRASELGTLDKTRLNGAAVLFADGTRGIVQYREEDGILIDAGPRQDGKPLVGEIAVFDSGFAANGEFLTAGALDNRAACEALIEVLLSGPDCCYDTDFVFTVQNKTGRRGAAFAANALRPSYALSIGAVACEEESAKAGIRLGGGPCVKLRDRHHIGHEDARAVIARGASAAGIGCQFDAGLTGSFDSSAIHVANQGVIAGSLAIPVRYLNAPVEACSASDLKQTARLIAVLTGILWDEEGK